jgi:hypothetical protein
MIVKHHNAYYAVELLDDGTLDTVVRICVVMDGEGANITSPWQEVRFSQEFAADFRDDSGVLTDEGFKALAEEAADEYDQLTEWIEDRGGV